ncbi:MAG: SDR family oxidoreductase, partial [Clostridia bacterium]
PTQFVKLDKLPLNNNGKVDKNKLICEKDKHIIKINKNKTYVGEYKKIYDLFSSILNKTDIDENDNFFDIGGDSLLAVKFVTKAMGQNIIITYSDLYKYSTIKSLSDMLTSKNEKKSISEPIKQFNYTKINEILANNIYNDKINYDMKENIGNILLAGATGFLGAHILDAYMKNEKGKIYCIIRPNKNEDPTFRLKEKMLFFFGEKYISEIGKRIIVIEGDITNSRIITNEDEYDVIVKNVDTVINSAAHVKHFGKLNLFEEINVRGTKNLVDFCLLNKKKFIHLSTLSVSGNILETGQVEQTDILSNTIYDESNFYISQNLDNVYAYTKFMSEKIVYDAIVKDKLNAKIMRMGNLTGRYSDGKFQPNVEDNAFANRLKTIIELGVIPQNILDFYL